MAQHFELKIPVTMQDLNTGVERPALEDEVRVGVDTPNNSLTHWPDEALTEGGSVAWWSTDPAEPGTVVFQKLRGSWINYGNFYFIGVDQEVNINIDYVFNTAYFVKGKLYVNTNGTWYWIEYPILLYMG